MKLKRSNAELKSDLVEQLSLLQAYCGSFDFGKSEFAKPMATSLRLLLHQTPKSQSLLFQLRLRSGRYFTQAPPLVPGAVTSECNLVHYQIEVTKRGPIGRYVPNMEVVRHARKRIPFPEWWGNPVAKSVQGETLSRRDIVCSVADADGGAHVDIAFSPLYSKFRSGEFLNFRIGVDGVDSLIGSPQYASIRTIAHESLLTLERYSPWAFKSPYDFPVGPFSAAA